MGIYYFFIMLLLLFLFLHELWIYLGFWLLLRHAHFGFWLELLFYICRHIHIAGTRTLFFFFGGVGNKWIKEFSLFCFSFKNLNCVYVLLIKIQFLTFISDKSLMGIPCDVSCWMAIW